MPTEPSIHSRVHTLHIVHTVIRVGYSVPCEYVLALLVQARQVALRALWVMLMILLPIFPLTGVMIMAVANARMTIGSVFGLVQTAANTVTGTLDAVASDVGMATAYFENAADQQKMRIIKN